MRRYRVALECGMIGIQRRVKQVRSSGLAGRHSCCPSRTHPQSSVHVRCRPRALDAVLAIVPLSQSHATAVRMPLPESVRWRALHSRAPARASTVRSTVCATSARRLPCWAICTRCERLRAPALAGAWLKANSPVAHRAAVGLAAAAGARDAAAVASRHCSLPRSRMPSRCRATAQPSAMTQSLERVVLLRLERFDTRYARGIRRRDQPGALAHRAAAQRARRQRLPADLLHDARAAARPRSCAGSDERALQRARRRRVPGGRRGQCPSATPASPICATGQRARGAHPDVALVGKGILFDTGGINLKPHRSMLDMHTDMAGSAVALATLIALAELRAPLAADAWLAITENHIGPHAYRPQDVVRAANGTTIQVIHTDAEGRMVLADTLALAARTRPQLMIDFATLTGACVYALTERMSGVFTNRPALAAQLVAAGRHSGERVWSFPFDGRLRRGSREQGRRCRAVRRRRQGRSHSRGALPGALRARGNSLGACGSVLGHAQRRTCARRDRDHRLRRALYAGAAAASEGAAAAWSARDERTGYPPAGRLAPAPARRRGAGRGAALHRGALRARDRHAEPESAGHDHARSRSPTASASSRRCRPGASFEPLMTLYLTDRTEPEEIERAQRQRASSAASSIRPAPPRIPMPASPTCAASRRRSSA